MQPSSICSVLIGWDIEVPFEDPFCGYEDGADYFDVYKYGRIVHITGKASVTRSITLNATEQVMGYLSEDYKPHISIIAVMQGSSAIRWMFYISSSGVVLASRYGYGRSTYEPLSAKTSSSAGSWLPFAVTYISAQ